MQLTERHFRAGVVGGDVESARERTGDSPVVQIGQVYRSKETGLRFRVAEVADTFVVFDPLDDDRCSFVVPLRLLTAGTRWELVTGVER